MTSDMEKSIRTVGSSRSAGLFLPRGAGPAVCFPVRDTGGFRVSELPGIAHQPLVVHENLFGIPVRFDVHQMIVIEIRRGNAIADHLDFGFSIVEIFECFPFLHARTVPKRPIGNTMDLPPVFSQGHFLPLAVLFRRTNGSVGQSDRILLNGDHVFRSLIGQQPKISLGRVFFRCPRQQQKCGRGIACRKQKPEENFNDSPDFLRHRGLLLPT